MYKASTHGKQSLVIRDDIQNHVARLAGKQVQRQLNHFNQQAAIGRHRL